MEQQITAPAQQSSLSEKRPRLVTILCIIGFICAPLVLAGLFLPLFTRFGTLIVPQFGPLFIPISLLIILLGIVGLVGYWKMRKWGVYVYTIAAVIYIGHTLFTIGYMWFVINPLGTAFILGLVGVGFANLKKMT